MPDPIPFPSPAAADPAAQMLQRIRAIPEVRQPSVMAWQMFPEAGVLRVAYRMPLDLVDNVVDLPMHIAKALGLEVMNLELRVQQQMMANPKAGG